MSSLLGRSFYCKLNQHQLNNTLANKMCPKAGNADDQTHQWQTIFAPSIVDRLNRGAPGANLTDVDIPYLISLCPFETVAKQKWSPFCALFTREEFEAFEYYGDLNKFYGYGYVFGMIHSARCINECFTDMDRLSAGCRA